MLLADHRRLATASTHVMVQRLQSAPDALHRNVVGNVGHREYKFGHRVEDLAGARLACEEFADITKEEGDTSCVREHRELVHHSQSVGFVHR